MNQKLNLLVTLSLNKPIKDTTEVSKNVAEGILHQAMNVGITLGDDEGFITDIKVAKSDGTPQMHVKAGHHPKFLRIENQVFIDGPTEKQKSAMELVATGLLSIAHDMENDERFRKWIETTLFFNHFNQSIDEVGRLIQHMILETEERY